MGTVFIIVVVLVIAISVTVQRYYLALNGTRRHVVTTDYLRKLQRTAGRCRQEHVFFPKEKYKTLNRKPFKCFFMGDGVYIYRIENTPNS